MDRFESDGLTFDVTDAGPSSGPLVVLLHGYPQNRTAWRHLAPPLVDAGYRVVAPDQRGYSPDARPKGRRAYALPRLVGDVVALAGAAGADRFHVVGHDWGGAVGWGLAASHGDRLASLTVLSTPHPLAFAASFVRSSQLLRSWYIAFYQLPWLPEAVAAAHGGALLRRALVRTGLPEPFVHEYAAMLESGAARPAVNWYRAMPFTPPSALRPVAVPTLYVYGAGDVALSRAAADRTARYVTAPYRYEVLEPASHWLPEVHADDVAAVLLPHLAAHAL